MGDPGIEPGVGRPGGVTVRCRTLQLVAHRVRPEGVTGVGDTRGAGGRQPEKPPHSGGGFSLQSRPLRRRGGRGQRAADGQGSGQAMKKPAWVIEKEQARRKAAAETVWLFGLHAVRDALLNPRRNRLRLVVTRNALDRLADAVATAGIAPEISDPRRFAAPLDPESVHQGAALEVRPLDWGPLAGVVLRPGTGAPRLVLLDRVTDPHNVGAILRSAEVFGAQAVIGTERNSAPETGALAKAASGALERQPYLRLRNLADTMEELRAMGFVLLGLDGAATETIGTAARDCRDRPAAIVLGAEGPGLRERTRATCDRLVRIPAAGDFGSLNVSNAAAVALYALGGDAAPA